MGESGGMTEVTTRGDLATPSATPKPEASWWSPSTRLSDVSSSRDNNFNLIRMIAASLVLFSHSFALVTGNSLDQPLARDLHTTLGTISVDVFFVTSGFLIAASITRRRDIAAFSLARIRRIYPAMLAATAMTVFGLGAIMTTNPILDYFTDPRTFGYLVKNSLIIDGVASKLPGVFVDNPFAGAVNGSLWTLPFEVRAYVAILVLWVATRAIQRTLDKDLFSPLLLLLGSVGLFAFLSQTPLPFVSGVGVRLYAMFFVGSSFFVLQRHIVLHTKAFVALVALVALLSGDATTFHLAYGISIAYLVFFLAHIPRGAIRAFNRFGDYSYGMYIFAFPVQQTLVAVVPSISIPEMIGASFTLTLGLAALSWHFVEKPALRPRSLPKAGESGRATST